MNYALGCAFTASDLFANFPYKKLKTNCKECFKAINDNHRQILVKRIFRYSAYLIIQDIVCRNVTFWLPLTGRKKCNMHMKRVTGKDFQNLRRVGKWEDVDIVKSMFSGYEIGFYMLGDRTPRVKTVYVNKEFKEKITENTNNGMSYGDSCLDTTIYDYFEQINDKFPSIPKQDIKTILIYAWKSIYLHNSYGGDFIIKDSNLWCYIGTLKRTPLQHFLYYLKKLIVKTRISYKRSGSPWDGYYYFALTENEYLNYLAQKHSKGRPKKWFKFKNIFVYEILKECKLREYSKKYIFRFPIISKLKIKLYILEITTQAELIEIQNTLKFKDILTLK